MGILDGKALAKEIRETLKQSAAELTTKPRIAVILVGDNPASVTYVKNKKNACEDVGFESVEITLPENVTHAELLKQIDALNEDSAVHAILCQLPLPRHIDEQEVLERISPMKDADCFNPINVGRFMVGRPFVKPCTPWGVIELLKASGIRIAGKNAVVIGRSNIVGLPLARLLLAENATVTICHTKTRDLPEICQQADILCVAIGRPEFVKGFWVKEGAIVVDIGMNRIPDESKESGYRLVGDVAFNEAQSRAALIAPVPGGVGPMTIAMLLLNAYSLYMAQAK